MASRVPSETQADQRHSVLPGPRRSVLERREELRWTLDGQSAPKVEHACVARHQRIDARDPGQVDEELVIGVAHDEARRSGWIIHDHRVTADGLYVSLHVLGRDIPAEALAMEDVTKFREERWRDHELECTRTQLDQQSRAGPSRGDQRRDEDVGIKDGAWHADR